MMMSPPSRIHHANRRNPLTHPAKSKSDSPDVNGGLFSGTTDVPRFSKIARSYLIHIGSLDWTKINPDIFGWHCQVVCVSRSR